MWICTVAEGSQAKYYPGMENKLFYLINRVQQALYKDVDRQAKKALGVTSAQAGALFHLQKRNGCLQVELGDALGLGKAATSGMVDRLEKNGLVKKVPSQTDNRGHRVLITALGLEVMLQARPLLERTNLLLEDGFTDDELSVVRRYLSTVERRVTEHKIAEQQS